MFQDMCWELKAVFSQIEQGHSRIQPLVDFGFSSRVQELSLLQIGGTPFQKDTLASCDQETGEMRCQGQKKEQPVS